MYVVYKALSYINDVNIKKRKCTHTHTHTHTRRERQTDRQNLSSNAPKQNIIHSLTQVPMTYLPVIIPQRFPIISQTPTLNIMLYCCTQYCRPTHTYNERLQT